MDDSTQDPFGPLNELKKPQNIFTRLKTLEALAQAQDSAQVDTLEEIVNDTTGTLVVDELIAPAPDVTVTDPTDTAFYGAGVTGNGRTFGSLIMNFWAVAAGILQVGFNNMGQLVWAAGKAVADVLGITLTADVYPSSAYIKWISADTAVSIGQLIATYAGAVVNSGLLIYGQAHDNAVRGFVQLGAKDDAGTVKNTLTVDTNGSTIVDLTAVNGAAGSTGFYVKAKTTATNVLNSVMRLYAQTTGTVANAFGVAIEYWLPNSTPVDVEAGYTSVAWTDKTAGSEDSQYGIGLMVAGVLTTLLSLDSIAGLVITGKIAASNTVTGSNLSGTNTGDQVLKFQMGGHGALGTVPLSATAFLGPFVTLAPQATEADVTYTNRFSLTASNFFIRTRTAQPASGSLTVTLRAAAANTAVTLTIAAGAAAAIFTDVTHSATIAGNGITVGCVNAGTAVSAQIASWGMECDVP